MESENITFLQVLRIKDAELWEVKNNELFCRDKGYLYVLYCQALNFYILRVHEQKWALDKTLNIIGTQSVQGTTTLRDVETKLPTYLIPSFGGFFMIKIHDPNPGVPLNNFETILQNCANFTRRTGLEKRLASFHSGHKPESGLVQAAETIKEGVLEAVVAVKKAFSSVEIDAHPNQRLARSFEELTKELDSSNTPVVDISKTEIQNMKNEGEEISKNHLQTGLWAEFMQGDGPNSLSQGVDLLNLSEGQNLRRKMSFNKAGEENTVNIDKKEDPTSRDNQELLGSENQRLPAYEVHSSKEHVEEGLCQCGLNMGSGIEDLPSHMQESIEFGVGLMCGPELTEQDIKEIQSGSRSHLDVLSKTNLDEPSTSTTQTQASTQSKASENIDLLTGDTDTTSVSKPSGGLGEISNKQALGSQSSEKQSQVSKPIDKENVGGTVTI